MKGTPYGTQPGSIRLFLHPDGGVFIALKEGVNHLEALCLSPEEAIKLASNLLKVVKDGLVIEEAQHGNGQESGGGPPSRGDSEKGEE